MAEDVGGEWIVDGAATLPGAEHQMAVVERQVAAAGRQKVDSTILLLVRAHGRRQDDTDERLHLRTTSRLTAVPTCLTSL